MLKLNDEFHLYLTFWKSRSITILQKAREHILHFVNLGNAYFYALIVWHFCRLPIRPILAMLLEKFQ
jgi:hypothetical protein